MRPTECDLSDAIAADRLSRRGAFRERIPIVVATIAATRYLVVGAVAVGYLAGEYLLGRETAGAIVLAVYLTLLPGAAAAVLLAWEDVKGEAERRGVEPPTMGEYCQVVVGTRGALWRISDISRRLMESRRLSGAAPTGR